MVGGGGAGFEEADVAACVGCGGGDDFGEVLQADVVGAGAGDEDAAGGEHAEGAEVEFLVAAEGTFEGAFGFGEGGRVEDDGVEALVGVVVAAEEIEGVGFDPIDLRTNGGGGEAVAIKSEVLFGDFEGGAAAVDAGDAFADLRKMEGEAALVGADVESAGGGSGGLGVVGGGVVVEALVEEGAGFLAAVAVVVEAEAVEGEGGFERAGGGVFEERCGRWCGEVFELADAPVGAFDDGAESWQVAEGAGAFGGEEFFREEFAEIVLRGALGEELEEDEVAVAVGDDAGEVVGFREDEADGIGCGVVCEHASA